MPFQILYGIPKKFYIIVSMQLSCRGIGMQYSTSRLLPSAVTGENEEIKSPEMGFFFIVTKNPSRVIWNTYQAFLFVY